MKYREIEYQVVQTANPTGWKWTVHLDGKRTKTGAGYSRASAIALAQRAIDKAVQASAKETAMPKFFISFQNGDVVAKDDEGHECFGLEEAKEAALASAREILADNIKGNAKDPLRAVMIADESGQTLLTIPAKDILPKPLS